MKLTREAIQRMISQKQGTSNVTVINQEGGGGGGDVTLGPLLTSLNAEAMPTAEGYLHWTGSAWAFDTPTGGDPVDLTPYALKTWVQTNYASKDDIADFITKDEADTYYAALNHTHANYLPLSAGANKALTGSLYFSGNSGINWAGGVGMLACTPESGWTGISSSQWGVGALSAQGVIRSNANDILHYRNGNSYKIWDAYNFTPSDYLPLTGGTVESLTVTNGLDADAITVGSIVNSNTLAEYLDADAMQTWGDGRYLKLTDKSGLFTQLANYDGALQITIGGTQKSLTIAYANAAGSANTAVNADKLDNHHAADFALASSLGNYLPLTGGTLTGNLIMNGAGVGFGPNGYYGYIDYSNSQLRIGSGAVHVQSDGVFLFNGDQVATQPWVTAQLGSYLPLTGGTLTGPLRIVGNDHQNLIVNSKAETSGVKWTGIQFNHQTNNVNTFYGGIRIDEQNGALKRYTSAYTVYTVWDSGNFNPSNYLPLTGGTVQSLTVTNGLDADSITVESIVNSNTLAEYLDQDASDARYLAIGGNAASATKLNTARTLWGQSFDGTSNISGAISNTGNITPSASDTYSIGTRSNYYNTVNAKYLCIIDDKTNEDFNIRWWPADRASDVEGYVALYAYETRIGDMCIGSTNPTYGLYFDASANKWGIGTNSPAEKLDVNGNVRVNGLYLNSDQTDNLIISNNKIQMSVSGTPHNIVLFEGSTANLTSYAKFYERPMVKTGTNNGTPVYTNVALVSEVEAKQDIIHFLNTNGNDSEVSFSYLHLPLSNIGAGHASLDLSSYMPLAGDSIKTGKLAVGTTAFDGSNAKLQVGGNMFATGSITSKSNAGNVSLGNGNISATNLYISTVVFGTSNNDPAIYIGNGHVYARNSQGQTTMII